MYGDLEVGRERAKKGKGADRRSLHPMVFPESDVTGCSVSVPQSSRSQREERERERDRKKGTRESWGQ